MNISVITVSYNASENLEKTIRSVIHQTFPNLEYIIIDGGSNDNSVEVIKMYSKDIDVWVSEPDSGIYDAMNKGIRKATGEYVLMMNAGDVFYDEHVLEKVASLFDDKDIVSGKALMSNHIWLPAKEEELSLSFFITKSLNHQATFMKRSLFADDKYDTRYKISSDSLFFCKKLIFENSSYKAIDEYVAICEDSGLSSRAEQSFYELTCGIKELLPNRMSYDYDFIHLYHNEVVLWFGKLIRKSDMLRRLFHKIRNMKKMRH